MKTWAGGGSRAYGLPPRPRQSELGRRRHQAQVEKKPGLSNTRLDLKKNINNGILCNFENRKL